jgi:uncharacterized protein (TIGR03435 family)
MRLPMVPVVLGILASGVFGQAPPTANLTFEVASVRPAAEGPRADPRSREGAFDQQSVTFRGARLIQIICAAYGVNSDRISGPGWIYDEHYDILAKTPPGTTRAQANVMLQNLLAERFKLVLHHASKEFAAYELTVAKGGPKLKETADPTVRAGRPGDLPRDVKLTADGFPEIPPGVSAVRSNITNGVTYMTARAQPVSILTIQLAMAFGTPTSTNSATTGHVIDHTGLTRKYDFTLEFAGQFRPGRIVSAPPLDATDPAPDIFQALEKQLGLRLTKSTSSEDTLVIDHIEKVPTEN